MIRSKIGLASRDLLTWTAVYSMLDLMNGTPTKGRLPKGAWDKMCDNGRRIGQRRTDTVSLYRN